MKILIVGAGASGLILAIRLKLNNPKYTLIIIDKNQKAGRKLAVSGNGRCNIGNFNLNSKFYRNKAISEKVFSKYNLQQQLNFFESLGIKTKCLDKLYYPYSESAKAFVDYLFNYAVNLGIVFGFQEELFDYKSEDGFILAYTNKAKYKINKLVFATGGKSYAKLGSDGTCFDILKKHNYAVTDLNPGLCPIRTVESTKNVSGLRVKGKVTLFLDKKEFYKEDGEVLFKNDGLSGIVIFNISSIISRNINKFKFASINLDLFPSYTLEQLVKEFTFKASLPISNFLSGYFIKNVAEYIFKRAKINYSKQVFSVNEIKEVARICKNLNFTFSQLYDFDNAQITIGGLASDNLKEDFSSKIEKNVYFVGEILDNDGLCGGYNLMWAFGSALFLGDILCK